MVITEFSRGVFLSVSEFQTFILCLSENMFNGSNFKLCIITDICNEVLSKNPEDLIQRA